MEPADRAPAAGACECCLRSRRQHRFFGTHTRRVAAACVARTSRPRAIAGLTFSARL